jgi:hypothetical protein
MLLLFSGAFVTVSHLYQHCIADANSLVTGCEVCQSIAGTSVNPSPVVDPVVFIFRCQPENLAVTVADAELPNSGSRGPPLY